MHDIRQDTKASLLCKTIVHRQFMYVGGKVSIAPSDPKPACIYAVNPIFLPQGLGIDKGSIGVLYSSEASHHRLGERRRGGGGRGDAMFKGHVTLSPWYCSRTMIDWRAWSTRAKPQLQCLVAPYRVPETNLIGRRYFPPGMKLHVECVIHNDFYPIYCGVFIPKLVHEKKQILILSCIINGTDTYFIYVYGFTCSKQIAAWIGSLSSERVFAVLLRSSS